MTAAMWLAWLLRGDVRAGSDTADIEAQKDFVSWWLLFAHDEYKHSWWYGPEQVRVAMEPAPACPALPRLLLRLHQARLDLQRAFDLSDHEQIAGYLCWYRLAGAEKLPVAPALPSWALALTEAASPRYGEPSISRMALALWATSPSLQTVIDPQSAGARRGLTQWYASRGQHQIPAPTALPDSPEIRPADVVRPGSKGAPCINLVGFARAEFGIGEDVRMVSRALEALGVAHSITDLRLTGAVRSHDESRSAWFGAAPDAAAINVFCLTGFDSGQHFLEHGTRPFQGAYNIGYWPWELPRFPDQWSDVYGLVDEVWAATRFQADAYRANSPVPVTLMPPAVTPPLAPRPVRIGAGRPGLRHRFTFIFPFDPNSTLARKNPAAAVRAFRAAFPLADRTVRLVLRVNGYGRGRPGWLALKAAIRGDTRIRIIEGTLPRRESLRMLQAADCLVSPHRAEGFGRNIAEAIALAVPVLATGFSGSSDLLEKAERIASKPRLVKPGEYPHAEGLSWSEPDWRGLARQMQAVRRRRQSNTVLIRRARRLLHRFGLRPAGERYEAAFRRIRAVLAGS